LHEDFTLSGRYSFFSKNIVPQRIEVLNFHLSLQSGKFLVEVKKWKILNFIVQKLMKLMKA
jgi:hypothetical protein